MKGQNQLFKVVMVGALALGICGAAEAAPRNGLSFGLGLGSMVPADEDSYMGIGADLYPELQIAYDIETVNIAFSAGYIYRKEEIYGPSSDEYQLSFVPLEMTASILPARFAHQDSVVEPYFGIGAGGFIATGDNEDHYAMVSPHLGIEFQLGQRNVLGLDFSYHVVMGEDGDQEESNLDYFTAMLVYRFRIPFEETR